MEINEQFEVSSAQSKVYSRFADVADVGTCIAGVQEIDVVNADESRWRMVVTAGFMSVTLDLDARITERIEPERISFLATGQNVDIRGDVRFTATAPARTHCEIDINIEPRGSLAPLMLQLGRGPQEQLAKQTIANLRERLSIDCNGETSMRPRDEARSVSPASRPGTPRARLALTRPLRVGFGALIVVLAYIFGRARARA